MPLKPVNLVLEVPVARLLVARNYKGMASHSWLRQPGMYLDMSRYLASVGSYTDKCHMNRLLGVYSFAQQVEAFECATSMFTKDDTKHEQILGHLI